jgi:hypothetical protein
MGLCCCLGVAWTMLLHLSCTSRVAMHLCCRCCGALGKRRCCGQSTAGQQAVVSCQHAVGHTPLALPLVLGVSGAGSGRRLLEGDWWRGLAGVPGSSNLGSAVEFSKLPAAGRQRHNAVNILQRTTSTGVPQGQLTDALQGMQPASCAFIAASLLLYCAPLLLFLRPRCVYASVPTLCLAHDGSALAQCGHVQLQGGQLEVGHHACGTGGSAHLYI